MGFVGLAMAAVMVVVDFGCGGFGWVISYVFWFWLALVDLVLVVFGFGSSGLQGWWVVGFMAICGGC